MDKLSFPGIGIDPFEIDRVAFKIFGLEIYWYGVIITIGMILAVLYTIWRTRQIGILIDDVSDIAIFTIIFGIIGARLYYVLTSLDQYDSILEVFAIRDGGLAIYGGIICGALTVFTVCKIKKLNWLALFDCITPGVMIAQALGRWGNFFNVEAYGSITKLPWRMCSESIASELYYGGQITLNEALAIMDGSLGVHPTFLYECLWNVLGFVLINIFYKKKKFDGQIALSYFAWYGFGRMLIEGLRTDSLYVLGFRISQVIGFLCFTVCTAVIVYVLIRKKKVASNTAVALEGVTEENMSDDESPLEDSNDVKIDGEKTDADSDKNEENEETDTTPTEETTNG
jgi:phosphatidylglycerol:prolipoprotein diacylglycerol transferase